MMQDWLLAEKQVHAMATAEKVAPGSDWRADSR
jgi:hypothetical protein